MVEELKKIIDKAEKLSDTQQRNLARLIEEEINWDETLTLTQNELAHLAKEVLQEHRAGKTKETDW